MESVGLNDVTIVIVTFNSAHCLPSLGKALTGFENVIVVDNGSDDGCLEGVAVYLPQAQVLAQLKNLGFGAANNRALARVRTPFALLLNPDCEISPDAVRQLLQSAAQWPEAAIVAPQLVQPGGKLEVNYRWPLGTWRSSGPPVTDGVACVGFVCGAAMLLRMSVIGDELFDEHFFLYYEDDDLCTRLFKQHHPMLIDPAATAIHRSRGSVRGRSPLRSEYLRGYHHAQSKLVYTQKYQGAAAARKQQVRLIVQTTLLLPLRAMIFNPRLMARIWGRFRGASTWRQL